MVGRPAPAAVCQGRSSEPSSAPIHSIPIAGGAGLIAAGMVVLILLSLPALRPLAAERLGGERCSPSRSVQLASEASGTGA